MSEKRPEKYFVIKALDKNVYLKTGWQMGKPEFDQNLLNFCKKYNYPENKTEDLSKYLIWQQQAQKKGFIPDGWKNTLDQAGAITDKKAFNEFLEEAKTYLPVYKDFLQFAKEITSNNDFKKLVSSYNKNYFLESSIDIYQMRNFEFQFAALNLSVRNLIKKGFEYEYVDHVQQQVSNSGYAIFFMHQDEANSGYKDPQQIIGSLNKAKIFSTPETALKFAGSKGKLPPNMAIVKINLEVIEIYQHNFKTLPKILSIAGIIQEKKQITDSEQFNEVETLKQKLAEYEKVLVDNGLLEAQKTKKAKML